MIDSQLEGAKEGADLRSTMGSAGDTVSASAMGFGIQGNDYEAQFFESGNFTSDQYAQLEAMRASTPEGEEFDFEAAAQNVLGFAEGEEISPEQ